MNSDVKQKLHEKKRAWKKYWFIRSKANLIEYKKVCNHATNAVKKARKNLEERIAAEVKDHPDSFRIYIKANTKERQPWRLNQAQ